MKEIRTADDITATGLGVKYDLGGGMTIAATTMKAEDTKRFRNSMKSTQQT